MNIKRFSFISSILFLFVISLSSCSLPREFRQYDYSVKDSDSHEEVKKDNYYKLGDYESFKYKNLKGEDVIVGSTHDVYRHRGVFKAMNSVGEANLLVIPIEFSDYRCEELKVSKETYINNVKNAFFGDPSNVMYESVASYFNKSSYGKLKIKGKVVEEFFTSPYSVNYLNSHYDSERALVLDIKKEALKWYESKYKDIEDFYIEGDKNLGIPVYFVYTMPSANTNKSYFWAYTFINDVLAWSSYSTMKLDYRNLPDTHTFIHECGHLLSLNDYYPTNDSKFSPTGRIDIMDYSIGDETAYSKMLLNWTRPYVVTNSGSITIRSFEESGDLILIKNNWNKTALDEYLLIELYTPTYLNEYDASYGNSQAVLPPNPGLKVYHVDSRVGYFRYIKSNMFLGYVDENVCPNESFRLEIVHTNSYSSKSEITKRSLYHLLENHEANTFSSGAMATNKTFWYAHDDFGISCFKDFTFNSGDKLGYTFVVDSLNSKEAKITFTKL